MAVSPLVSVLMPAHNSELYLPAAIESILQQTLADFELIVVDDGSTDRTAELLEQYQLRDHRLRVFQQENQGISATRNRCLDLASGKYLAWLDSDDVARPTRIAKQVAFMEANPDIGASGTWVKTIGHSGGALWRYPVGDATLRSMLIFNPPFANSSTMVRRNTLTVANLRYEISYAPAEDYELWVRAAQHFSIANLPEVLVLYRLHSQQATETRYNEQVAYSGRVRAGQIARLGLEPTPNEFECHQRLSQFDLEMSHDALDRAEQWLLRLQEANNIQGVFPKAEFGQVVKERWFFACRGATRLGHSVWERYWSSPLSRQYPMRLKTRSKFFVFSTLRLRS